MFDRYRCLDGNAGISSPAAAEGDGSGALRTYEVTLTSRAAGQPISPPVLVTHDRDIRFWHSGWQASEGIIAIAEDGNPDVVAMLEGEPGITDVVNVGQPLIRKGTTIGDFTDSVTVTIQARPGDRLSFAGCRRGPQWDRKRHARGGPEQGRGEPVLR